jgi:hypothetical protein
MSFRIRWLSALAILFVLPLSLRAAEKAPGLKRLSTAEIEAMEARARAAREAFFLGQYAKAGTTFQELANDLTVSKPLYLCDQGSCLLATGDLTGAKRGFLDAANMHEGFFDAASERSAASLFGAETKKVFKGDPYELSMLGLFLALLSLQDNDVDNALSALKSAILADSDVANEMYKSDFALLYALESKCDRLRGNADLSQHAAEQARQAYRYTHPRVRSLVATKQKLMDSKQPHDAVDQQLEQAASAVPLQYVAPLTDGNYNTLLLIWSGRSPSKLRVGQYGEQTVYVINAPRDNRYEAAVDGGEPRDAIHGVADVRFQATTRGGRIMDNVLKSHAEFKGFTSSLGDSLISSAADNRNDAGSALMLLAAGLIAKGVSAAAHAAADIRQWGTLPDSLQIVPLTLAPGQHRYAVQEYDQYLRIGERTGTFTVVGGRPVNVVFVMPNAKAPASQPPPGAAQP